MASRCVYVIQEGEAGGNGKLYAYFDQDKAYKKLIELIGTAGIGNMAFVPEDQKVNSQVLRFANCTAWMIEVEE